MASYITYFIGFHPILKFCSFRHIHNQIKFFEPIYSLAYPVDSCCWFICHDFGGLTEIVKTELSEPAEYTLVTGCHSRAILFVPKVICIQKITCVLCKGLGPTFTLLLVAFLVMCASRVCFKSLLTWITL